MKPQVRQPPARRRNTICVGNLCVRAIRPCFLRFAPKIIECPACANEIWIGARSRHAQVVPITSGGGLEEWVGDGFWKLTARAIGCGGQTRGHGGPKAVFPHDGYGIRVPAPVKPECCLHFKRGSRLHSLIICAASRGVHSMSNRSRERRRTRRGL